MSSLQKTILSTLIICLPLIAKSSQDAFNKNGLLVTGGISKINLNYNDPPSYWKPAFRTGFSTGLSWEFCFSKHFSTIARLEYVRLGDKEKCDYMSPVMVYDSSVNQWETIDSIRVRGTTEKTLSYISFPVHLC